MAVQLAGMLTRAGKGRKGRNVITIGTALQSVAVGSRRRTCACVACTRMCAFAVQRPPVSLPSRKHTECPRTCTSRASPPPLSRTRLPDRASTWPRLQTLLATSHPSRQAMPAAQLCTCCAHGMRMDSALVGMPPSGTHMGSNI